MEPRRQPAAEAGYGRGRGTQRPYVLVSASGRVTGRDHRDKAMHWALMAEVMPDALPWAARWWHPAEPGLPATSIYATVAIVTASLKLNRDRWGRYSIGDCDAKPV